MALVVVCGFPASGKSGFAALIADQVRENNHSAVTVSDGGSPLDSDNSETSTVRALPSRSSLYSSSFSEKKTRADLRARTERALGTGAVVICDSLNYIKGFRYELYCAAREAGVRYCVVWTKSSKEECAERDNRRRPDEAYGAHLLSALIARFEEPRERDRWDRPLHKVDPFSSDAAAQAATVAHSVRKDAPQLAPTVATRQKPSVHADVLGILDRVTRGAEAALLAHIRSGKGTGDTIIISGASQKLVLARECKAAELRSMRRAHLNLARMHPPQDVSERAVLDGYVDFINAQLRLKL